MILTAFKNWWLGATLSLVYYFSLNIIFSQCQATAQVDTPVTFMQQALDLVNQLRGKHQSGPLKLNISLSADSEAWAKKIGAQCDKVGAAKAYYSRAPGVGENVWVSDSLPDVDGTIPITAWYNQVQNYNWSNNIFSYNTAQFSTLVWKSTNQFGIAKYKTPVKGYIMVVARFLPPGNANYYSSFAANVFPSLDTSTTSTTTQSPPLTTTAQALTTTTATIPIPSTIAPGQNPPQSSISPQGASETSSTTKAPGGAQGTSQSYQSPGAVGGQTKTDPVQAGKDEEIVFIPEQINQSVNG